MALRRQPAPALRFETIGDIGKHQQFTAERCRVAGVALPTDALQLRVELGMTQIGGDPHPLDLRLLPRFLAVGGELRI